MGAVQYVRKLNENHVYVVQPFIAKMMDLYPCSKDGALLGEKPIGQITQESGTKIKEQAVDTSRHISNISIPVAELDLAVAAVNAAPDIVSDIVSHKHEVISACVVEEKQASEYTVAEIEPIFLELAKAEGTSIAAIMRAMGINVNCVGERAKIDPVYWELAAKYKDSTYRDRKRIVWGKKHRWAKGQRIEEKKLAIFEGNAPK